MASYYSNLGVLYQVQEEYTNAELNFSSALSLREKALGSDHKLVAGSLSKLARLYWILDKTNAADFYFKRALKSYENALGRKHIGTVRILESYASFLDEAGRSDDVEKYRSRAEEIRKLYSG